jgi:hypothetical protein
MPLIAKGQAPPYILPCRMNGPEGGSYEHLRLLTLVLSRLLDDRRRAGDSGGCPRIRTANVYLWGPDLQSGAAHAIAARHPKPGAPSWSRTTYLQVMSLPL